MLGGQSQRPNGGTQVPPFLHGSGSHPNVDMQLVKMDYSFMRI